jgi:hypothetical protein
MPYDLFEHRHRFSVWAAARAAQRGFTTVDNLRHALELTDIRKFIEANVEEAINADQFAERHGKWCDDIVSDLKESGVQNVTFGRAAKLVAVYLKAMVVVGPHADTALARVAHPPIDRLLLQKLSGLEGVPDDVRRIFRTTNWTDLDRCGYDGLVDRIRQHVLNGDGKKPFWHLEQHWNVTQTDDS